MKINKFNMVGATGGSFKSFGETMFATNTMIVYANIVLPTVDAKTGMVAPATSGFKVDYPKDISDKTRNFLFSGSSATLTVGTSGIYTKHQLTLTDYTTAYSGTTIILTQATLDELHGHPNYSILKIITYGTITTPTTLTIEYKDCDDTTYCQFRNDVMPGYPESWMKMYRWRDSLAQWERITTSQSVDTVNNTVTATLDQLGLAQIYGVKIDGTVPVELSCFEAILEDR